MTKKIVLLVLIGGLAAAIATEAMSQSPSSSSAGVKSKVAPTAEKEAPRKSDAVATPSKSFVTTSQTHSSPGSSGKLVVEWGLVTLIDDVKVPANEAGMITGVPAKEGDNVEKDTLVARIDNRSTVAKQRIAKGEFDAATAQANNNAEVEVAKKAVEVSLAEYEQSKDIRKRNPGAVSETQLRKDQFTYEKSLAQVDQATNEKEIARLTATAKQAQYDAATVELDLREIKAPFGGQVVEVMKSVGEWVTVGEPIMHLVRLDRLRVKGAILVEQAEAAGVAYNDVVEKPVVITVESISGKKHTVNGFIGFASPVIDGYGSDRQFRIWAEVDNEKLIDPVTKRESWKIMPGSIATMTIDLSAPPAPLARTDAKADSAKSAKSKVESYKPVTGEDKTGGKKNKER
jgi:macrolide-specific efflux system membrane fusion protein